MTLEEAKAEIRRGASFGGVFEQLRDSGDRAALPEWFVHEKGVPSAETVRQRMAALKKEAEPELPAEKPPLVPKINRQQAKQAGYTGDECSVCRGMRVTRNGACLKCEECGSTTGCS